MNKQAKPLAAIFGYSSAPGVFTFLGRDDEVVVDLLDHITAIEAVLKHCSGRETWEQILEAEDIEEKVFWTLAEFLVENGIVIEGSDLYKIFHDDSSNPLRFPNSLSLEQIEALVNGRTTPRFSGQSISLVGGDSVLKDMIDKRKSHRAFLRKPINFDTLGTFLSTLYGFGEGRSTPSAGQMYPLEIFVVAMVSSPEIPRGIYWFDCQAQRLVSKAAEFTDDDVVFAMNTNLIDSAPYVICVAADLERVVSKYSNRGYRFALIEAGHLCQNAYLAAAELDLGVVSYGGFLDKPTKALISDGSLDLTPLVTMLLGYKDDPSNQPTDFGTLAIQLTDELVGEGKPVEWLSCRPIKMGEHQVPKFCSNAKFRYSDEVLTRAAPAEDMFGLGIASSDGEAKVKAAAEAFERYCSSVMRVDLKGRSNLLTHEWLDPNKITPMSEQAKREYGFMDFSPDTEIEWVKGYRYLSHDPVFVPVDHVYYPLRQSSLGRPLIYSSSSSGVAAFTDENTAIQRAMYELVERDALAILWYAKNPGYKIPRDFVSDEVSLRVSYWESNGWEVQFLDITLDSSPVVLALIAGKDQYPCFSAGASSADNYLGAIRKAWDEAETLMWGWKKRRLLKQRHPEEVVTPLDHGRLYFLPDHFERISWLLDFEERYPTDRPRSSPLEIFNPAVFDLSLPQYHSIKVFRVISEYLLPINFGYMTEHFGHRRFADLQLDWKESQPAFPHFLA